MPRSEWPLMYPIAINSRGLIMMMFRDPEVLTTHHHKDMSDHLSQPLIAEKMRRHDETAAGQEHVQEAPSGRGVERDSGELECISSISSIIGGEASGLREISVGVQRDTNALGRHDTELDRLWEKYKDTEQKLTMCRQQLEDAQKEGEINKRHLEKERADHRRLQETMKEKWQEVDAAHRRLHRITMQRDLLRTASEEEKARLATVQARLSHLEDVQKDAENKQLRLERVVKERDALRDEVAEKESLLKQNNAKLAQMGRRAQENDKRIHMEAASFREMMNQRDEEAKASRGEIAALRAHLESTTKLLDDRTRELNGARPFLIKTDTLSGADVIALVQALNADIFQLAAFMADSFPVASNRINASKDLQEARHRIREYLGYKLLKSLANMAHDDPTVLQMALQSYLAQCCAEITNAWTFDGSSAVLEKLYEHVRDAGDESHLANIRKHICTGFTDILTTANCQSKDLSGMFEAVTEGFGDRVNTIVEVALHINRVMGEITSGDMETVIWPRGVIFEPKAMDDAGGEAFSHEEEAIVLCTTELGLRKATQEGKGGLSARESTLLLKPKVALETLVAQMAATTKESRR
ncbi:hypothetical protein HWV62_24552 [Athelia sp. TMB]|nr:hypothetical protein HWV62_24552 [Athelia sp. TMB]